MRIIAGEFRSRKLHSPPEDVQTRPIPDRVKESIFSILRGHTPGGAFFDAFAGTGSIGLEALSRGAASCVFVEQDRRMAKVLERNIAELGVTDRTEVVVGDALGVGALSRCPRPVTIAFLDPPYAIMHEKLGVARVLAQVGALAERLSDDGFVLLRTPWPLFYELDDESHAGEPESRHRKGQRSAERRTPSRPGSRSESAGSRGGSRTRYRDKRAGNDWTEVWSIEDGELDDEAIEGLRAEAEEDVIEPKNDAAKAPRMQVELAVPGTLGPETHVYGSMAVHFYARKK
jgi:16S rRNA (guanine966-N2)-methyltransferase